MLLFRCCLMILDIWFLWQYSKYCLWSLEQIFGLYFSLFILNCTEMLWNNALFSFHLRRLFPRNITWSAHWNIETNGGILMFLNLMVLGIYEVDMDKRTSTYLYIDKILPTLDISIYSFAFDFTQKVILVEMIVHTYVH